MKIIRTLLMAILLPIGMQAQSLVMTEIMYNPPSVPGVEYLEIYNNGSTTVNLEGYTFSSGINFTFPNQSLNAGEYVVLTNNQNGFLSLYGFTAQQYSGNILNAGDSLTLTDSTGVVMDMVQYTPGTPWPNLSNGDGTSMELCDYNSDNNLATNWKTSTSSIWATASNKKLYGSPGQMNNCPSAPIVHLQLVSLTTDELTGFASFDVMIDNVNGSLSSVNISVAYGSADPSDITFNSPTKVSFAGSIPSSINVNLVINSDGVMEPEENLYLILSGPTNATILNDSIEIIIEADPLPPVEGLILVGVIDDESAGAPKAIELYAFKDIPDLSIYGIGSARNGGGSRGERFTFPADNVVMGTKIFITTDTTAFSAFFRIDADYLDDGGWNAGLSFNGNDGVELFSNGAVIDVFGDVDVNGTGTGWEHTNSWAKRLPNTGPDGDPFIIANWEFGGVDAFVGFATNAEAATPYPLEPTGIKQMKANNNLHVYPNPSSDFVIIDGLQVGESLSVTNLLGEVITQTVVLNPSSNLDISTYPNGVYFIKVIHHGKIVGVQKIIKN